MKEYIEREAARNIFTPPMRDPESLDFWEWLQSEIDAIPAADVRPVVRAHWTDHRTIEHDGEWYCSACGKEITIYMGPDRDDRYSFCPNCGADMREES